MDHDVEGDTLVVISGEDGRLRSTTDLRSWNIVGTVPSKASAVGLLEGVAYLGTSDSDIWRLSLQP